VDAEIPEKKPGPGHEILHGTGDEDLAGLGERGDSRSDMHGDAAELVPPR
jgi:hypothetical protein